MTDKYEPTAHIPPKKGSSPKKSAPAKKEPEKNVDAVLDNTKDILAIEEELQGEKDRYMRLMAEFDNYKKRTAKERESLITEVKARTVLEMLPILDNLERALSFQDGDAAAIKEGLNLVYRQCMSCFEKLGVKEIEAEGQPFDPSVHEAVMHCEEEGVPENTVSGVLQKGFVLGDKVIRHASVKVSN